MRLARTTYTSRRSMLALFLTAAFALLLHAEPAAAIPTLGEHWEVFCPSHKPNKRSLARAKAKVDSTGNALKKGIALLDYGCLLRQFEKVRHEKALDAFQKKGGQGAQPQLNHRGSLGQARQAAGFLKRASRKQTAQALYYYGYALALIGDTLAVNKFDDLMRFFKNSAETQQAYLALAEFYFDQKMIDKAMREYNVSRTSKNKNVSLYARYKLGWINFLIGLENRNQGKMRESIRSLTMIYNDAQKGKGKVPKRLAGVIKEDLINMLAELGSVADAQRILRQLGATDVFAALLERMALAKVAQNDTQGAYRLFAMMLKESPTNAENPRIAGNLVQLAAQQENAKLLVQNLRYMVGQFVNKKSKWRKGKSKKQVKQAYFQTEGLVWDYATSLDQQGRQAGNQVYIDTALQLYDLYLKNFEKTKKVPQIMFFKGQIAYIKEQWIPAGRAMIDLLKKYPKFPQRNDAIDIMVAAAQTGAEADTKKYDMPKEAGRSLRPFAIPASKKNFVEALELFMKYRPRDPNVPAMVLTIAGVYYDFGHYKEAFPNYMKYIKAKPNDEFSVLAAYRILDYHTHWREKKPLKKAKKIIGRYPPLRQSPDLQVFFAKPEKKKPKRSNVAERDRGDEAELEESQQQGDTETVADQENAEENAQEESEQDSE